MEIASLKNFEMINRLPSFVLFLALGFCWGPSYFFIKIAMQEIPAFTIVATRLSIGALLLYGFLRIQGMSLAQVRGQWHHFLVMGFFAAALPFSLITLGEKTVSSSLAAILTSTTPI